MNRVLPCTGGQILVDCLKVHGGGAGLLRPW
jgi:hypothetical protein